jgi:hypothetical protein
MSRIRLAVMVALAVVIAAGCSKESDAPKQMAEGMMEKALSQGGEQVKVKLPEKGSTDLTGLPETLRYPGAVPLAHVASEDPNTVGETFILQTDDSVSDVTAFFKKALADGRQTSLNETPQMVTMAYDSRDGKSAVGVVIGSRSPNGKISMNVTLTRK